MERVHVSVQSPSLPPRVVQFPVWLGTHHIDSTYRELYDGDWVHPDT